MRPLLIWLFAASAAGQITSIEPRQLPYFGGQFVIRGQNLSINCMRPHGECTGLRVELDGHRSHVNVIERAPDRVVVDVGPREIGAATVRLVREDRSELVAFEAINFSGAPESEAVLVPLIMGERSGAFGSRWATSFTAWNGFNSFFDPVDEGNVPAIVVRQDRRFSELDSMHLRVRDLNRQDTSWGTEIPIVRERDLRLEVVHLLDVPTDRRFRVSLRIYNVAPLAAARQPAEYAIEVVPFDPCCFADFPEQRIVRAAAPSATTVNGTLTWSSPGYIEINDFLARYPAITARTVRITVRQVEYFNNPAPPLFWAFASITHNATQHVTVVTPSERK